MKFAFVFQLYKVDVMSNMPEFLTEMALESFKLVRINIPAFDNKVAPQSKCVRFIHIITKGPP